MIPAGCARKIAILAALLLGGATAFTQQPGGAPMPSGPPQPAPQAPENPAAAGTNQDQVNFERMDAQDFVRNTLENDTAQVRLSQLAEQKSTSPDVKQFGEQMVKVHTELDHQFQPAAKQLGVDEPKGPSKKEKKEIAKMEALSGQEFETAYLQAMAREQQQTLKLFHKEAQNTANQALAQAARQDAQVLDQNFQILEKIAQAHNVDIESEEKK